MHAFFLIFTGKLSATCVYKQVTSSRCQVVQLSDTCILKSSCPDENIQLGYQRTLVPWTGGWLEFTLLEVCLLSC